MRNGAGRRGRAAWVAAGLCAALALAGSAAAPAAAKPGKAPVPASGTLTFGGDTGLAGAARVTQVSCNFPNPTADGSLEIFVLATAPNSQSFNMQVAKDRVMIVVSSGAGTTFVSRDFTGTGVKGFKAGKGVQLAGALTDTTPATAHAGTVGTITSLTGSLSCGSQTPGKSTLRFTGTTADGAVDTTLKPVRVECDTASAGNSVTVAGLGTAAGQRALFITTLAASRLSMFETIPGPPLVSHGYLATSGATLSTNGAHVTADLAEQNVTTGAPHTLHLAGKVTCGTTVNR